MDTLIKSLASTHANAVSELIAKERVNHCDAARFLLKLHLEMSQHFIISFYNKCELIRVEWVGQLEVITKASGIFVV